MRLDGCCDHLFGEAKLEKVKPGRDHGKAAERADKRTKGRP